MILCLLASSVLVAVTVGLSLALPRRTLLREAAS